MDKQLIKFGKRMDSAEDKKTLISYCEGAKRVLDLGAGTGAMAREIAETYGCHVDAVDLQWKSINMNTCNEKVNYIQDSIMNFIRCFCGEPYDCIILSAIIHELDLCTIMVMHKGLYRMMTDNCRIIIREPFYDNDLTLLKDKEKFIELVSNHIFSSKSTEYREARKLSYKTDEENKSVIDDQSLFWLNLAFVVSYGEDSWDREKHEYRYAYNLDWCKEMFNLLHRPYTGFQTHFVLDTTYRQHFINAGIPGEAFDLIGYTGMHVIIDYSR